MSFKLDMSALKKLVADAIDKMQETEELFEEIGEQLLAEILVAMNEEESLDGDKWKPVKRKGIALQDSGKLKESVDFRATADQVELLVKTTAKDRYPHVHNSGMVIEHKSGKQVTIPKREFIPNLQASPEAQDIIFDICEDFMDKVLGGKR